MLRKRPLLSTTMLGCASLARPDQPRIDRSGPRAVPLDLRPLTGASSEENRIDALTKLKSLFDTGVLTEEQYESEWARLTDGIRTRRRS